jgi:uncharacterized protein (TIGR03083 family)
VGFVSEAPSPTRVISQLRSSHDRVTGLVSGLDPKGFEQMSYCTEWTIADVLSHLGSQAEIFGMFFDAGASGSEPPGTEAFGPIWDAWNERSPEDKVKDSIAANELFVSRMESLDSEVATSFHMTLFGMELGLAELLRMRLAEHALHTWDVEVVLDPSARVPAGAVDVLVDMLPGFVARAAKPQPDPRRITVSTSEPHRSFELDTGGVSLSEEGSGHTDAAVELPAEALLRLVYGRLDDAHGADEVKASGVALDDLRAVFSSQR